MANSLPTAAHRSSTVSVRLQNISRTLPDIVTRADSLFHTHYDSSIMLEEKKC
jgi:hypothetical protein